MEYSPKKMQELLNKNSFYFKKNFGQNFIIDENIIRNIITASEIDEDTLVIEIGPGAGSLTYFLCQVARQVLCYEIDDRLKSILETNLESFNNVDIKFADFLKCDAREDIKKYNYKKLYVVANLPYYITTPIIVKLIDDRICVDKMVLMVQKEVGDRFKAKPGSRDYGSLSIFINYYYDVKKVLDVSKNVFIPKPNVDSIVVLFTKKDKKIELKDKDLFFKLIRDSFKQKRKTLRNNLKDYDLDVISKVLSDYGYDLSVRAENLSIEVFACIANTLVK